MAHEPPSSNKSRPLPPFQSCPPGGGEISGDHGNGKPTITSPTVPSFASRRKRDGHEIRVNFMAMEGMKGKKKNHFTAYFEPVHNVTTMRIAVAKFIIKEEASQGKPDSSKKIASAKQLASNIVLLRKGVALLATDLVGELATRGELSEIKWLVRDRKETDSMPRIAPMGVDAVSDSFIQLMANINWGFENGAVPTLTMDGTGGTYFMYNKNKKVVALFKPVDEEAFAPNNPRDYHGNIGQKGFRPGVLSGEGAIREIVAYSFAQKRRKTRGGIRETNIVGVPPAMKVECRHPKLCYKFSLTSDPYKEVYERCKTNRETTKLPYKEGSLQEFVTSRGICGDYDPSVFCRRDAQRIAIFDIAMLNLDRNDGNILVRDRIRTSSAQSSSVPTDRHAPNSCEQAPTTSSEPPPVPTDRSVATPSANLCASTPVEGLLTPDGHESKYELVPIDHGLILPDVMDVAQIDLCWFTWPQVAMPIGQEEKEIIQSIMPDEDANQLEEEFQIRPGCLRSMRASVRLLQIGDKQGLTLYQIAEVLCRGDDFEKPSEMEVLVKGALEMAAKAHQSSSFAKEARLVGMSAPNSIMMDLSVFGETRVTTDVNQSERSQGANDSVKCGTARQSEEASDTTVGRTEHRRPKGHVAPSARRETMNGGSSMWTVVDSNGKATELPWEDEDFERRFFKFLEIELTRHLKLKQFSLK